MLNSEVKAAIEDLFNRPSNSSNIFKKYLDNLITDYLNEAMDLAKTNDANASPEFRLGAASAIKELKNVIGS